MNQCHFMGNLTRKPELRNVGPRQTPVVNFAVAINRSYKKDSGEWVKETTFVECEAWATAAEAIANRFDKGDLILVHCSVKNETWEETDDDGNTRKRRRDKYRVNSFQSIPGTRKRATENTTPTGEDIPVDNDDDKEVPF